MSSSREVIIIVDDDVTSLTVGKNTLSSKYDVFTAASGERLFPLLDKLSPDLILLDSKMPGMDGYEVIGKLKSNSETAKIPVIFLTSKIDPESEVLGLNLGAVDYITKPFSRELLLKRVDLHVLFEKQRQELLNYNVSLASEVNRKTKTVNELQNTILRTVAELVECRDIVAGRHIYRTERYLRLLVEKLFDNGIYADEIAKWDIDLLVMSSQLHDVGKISIRDSILMKPGLLDETEYEEMKKHAEYGVEIIRKIETNSSDVDFLKYAEIMAGTHHERWDGKGYPHGLSKLDIPLQGRLMSIIDVYDALTNDRPYKPAFNHEQAIEIIKSGLGTQFDPLICNIFMKYEQEFRDIDSSTHHKHDIHDVRIPPALEAVNNEIAARGGKEIGYVARMRRYLEIFFDALLLNKNYGHIVSTWDKELFLISAQLHDVGNIAVADHILRKPQDLTEEEFEDMVLHVEFGLRIISELKVGVEDGSSLHHAEMLVGNHHERWDGTGYPRGLKGKRIPLQGRIMAIIDVYDALTTDRPHRSRKTHTEAVKAIANGSGTQFDPGLVEVFISCEADFDC